MGKMVLVMNALLLGINGQGIIQKKIGSCRRDMGRNIRKRKRCIIKNITGGK